MTNAHHLEAEVTARAAELAEKGFCIIQEALPAGEHLFRSLFDHHAAVNLLIDPRTGRIIDANEAAARFYGCSPSPRAAIFSCPCTP